MLNAPFGIDGLKSWGSFSRNSLSNASVPNILPRSLSHFLAHVLRLIGDFLRAERIRAGATMVAPANKWFSSIVLMKRLTSFVGNKKSH